MDIHLAPPKTMKFVSSLCVKDFKMNKNKIHPQFVFSICGKFDLFIQENEGAQSFRDLENIVHLLIGLFCQQEVLPYTQKIRLIIFVT